MALQAIAVSVAKNIRDSTTTRTMPSFIIDRLSIGKDIQSEKEHLPLCIKQQAKAN